MDDRQHTRHRIVKPHQTIIVDAADLITAFQEHVPVPFSDRDLAELITQIIVVLLNEEHGEIDGLNGLPHFDRLRDVKHAMNPHTRWQIQSATGILAVALYKRLHSLGIYHDNIFSYFFDRMLGNDIVISHFPY